VTSTRRKISKKQYFIKKYTYGKVFLRSGSPGDKYFKTYKKPK